MEKYEPLGVVGEGSYGVVLKCKCRDNGKTVAIKKFIDSEDDQNVRKIALREIRVLRKLRHENLVNLIEVFRRRKHIYLVFEFIDHTLLDQLEQKSHGLDEDTCRKYIYQILRGLNFCHENNIIHRDVKPENVLVSKNGIVKLCDFGFARNMCGPGEVFTDYVATRWYRAPELLVGDIAYGKEVDVWALGCLFAEMMTGEPLFPGDSDIDQLFLIAQCLGRLSKRHLNIMQRNSAFRGFQFPESHSRHGSTASTASSNAKMSKMTGGGGKENGSNKSSALSTMDGTTAEIDDRVFSSGSTNKTLSLNGSKTNSGSSGSRKKRLVSVERSVFASMFPSWPDETIQFLTLCLDPEPSGRPSCNSLMRLPYFTHDNFPARFIPEMNAKLQMEGRTPISAFSTRKKRSVPNNTSGNVSSSLSPTSRTALNVTNLQPKNPLHQGRSNLNQLEDEPISLTSITQVDNKTSSSRIQMQSNNLINFQNNSNSFQGQSSNTPQQQHQNAQSKFQTSMRDPSYFQLDKLPKDKTPIFNQSRKPSFSMNPEPSLANPSDTSKIPVLLNRKYSDDSLISSTGTLSTSSSPQNPTSKSTPNIAEESFRTSATSTNPLSLQNKEKRLSIQISTPFLLQSQAYQPPPAPKKYSFSFPTPSTMPSSGDGNSIDERRTPDMSPLRQQPNQLPVTTLTFSMNTSAGVNFSQSLVKSPGNVGPTGNNNNMMNGNTFSMYQKRSSPTTTSVTKPNNKTTFSVNNSSYFPQPIGYGNNQSLASTQNTFTYQNSMGNSKSLPVTIFGSSMLRNSNHANSNLGSVTESFLPRMTGKGMSSKGNIDENIGSLLSNGKF
ncbi:unnamed protein product [Orchesella dallaii]|uniref:Protein kinase domain-containing protein n=1 Tax=Orchesella dallaii TaxID=48710 RepID=A0ABP1RD65_9HEXA